MTTRTTRRAPPLGEPGRSFNFYVTEKQRAWLEEQAEKEGSSPSAVLRALLDLAMRYSKQP